MTERSATEKVLDQHLQLVNEHLEYEARAEGELWNDQAREELSWIVCAYCGHKTPRDDKMALFDHVINCEKRPEKVLLEKAFQIEDGLYKKIIHLTTHLYFPEECSDCEEIYKVISRYTEVK